MQPAEMPTRRECMTQPLRGESISTGIGEDRVIPPAVQHLAGEVFHNVSELEVALLARRWPLRVWDAVTVSRSLRIGDGQAEASLRRLASLGLLEPVGKETYRYHPDSTETSKALDALSNLYRSHRHAVLRLIFSRSKGAVSYFPPEREQADDR